MRVPVSERLSLSADIGAPQSTEYTRLQRTVTAGLLVSILIAVAILAGVTLSQQPAVTYTQFYVLGQNGSASGYPTQLDIPENSSVVIGVENRKGHTLGYTLRVDLAGVRVAYDETAQANESFEVNRRTMSWLNFTLENGQS